ncbi:hypothetical protein HDV00_007233, partial [Rhizophlyctis rosea]
MWRKRLSERVKEGRQMRMNRLVFVRWRAWAGTKALVRKAILGKAMKRWVDGVRAREELLRSVAQQSNHNHLRRAFGEWRRWADAKRRIKADEPVESEADRVARLNEMKDVLLKKRVVGGAWGVWRREWRKRRFEAGRKQIFADSWAETALKRRVFDAWVGVLSGVAGGGGRGGYTSSVPPSSSATAYDSLSGLPLPDFAAFRRGMSEGVGG